MCSVRSDKEQAAACGQKTRQRVSQMLDLQHFARELSNSTGSNYSNCSSIDEDLELEELYDMDDDEPFTIDQVYTEGWDNRASRVSMSPPPSSPGSSMLSYQSCFQSCNGDDDNNSNNLEVDERMEQIHRTSRIVKRRRQQRLRNSETSLSSIQSQRPNPFAFY